MKGKSSMQYTTQEAFNRAAVHLLKQGRKSSTNKGLIDFCLYRGPEGTACAVGCLIPDKEYKTGMEQEDISSIVSKVPALHGLEYTFLVHLQIIHDDSDPEVWPDKLRLLADMYNLDTGVLDATNN